MKKHEFIVYAVGCVPIELKAKMTFGFSPHYDELWKFEFNSADIGTIRADNVEEVAQKLMSMYVKSGKEVYLISYTDWRHSYRGQMPAKESNDE